MPRQKNSCMQQPKTKRKCSVAAVIFNEDRTHVLLIKRRDVPIWVLPGGGVDPGETPENAVLREILEETGVLAKVARQVALYTPLNRLTNHSYLFECKTISGELTTGAETQEVRFFPLERLPSPCFFLHQQWIEDAKIPSQHILEKPLTQVTYLNLLKYFLAHPMQVIRLVLSRCGLPFNTPV